MNGGGTVPSRHSPAAANGVADIAQVHAVANGKVSAAEELDQIVEVESDDSPPYLPAKDGSSIR